MALKEQIASFVAGRIVEMLALMSLQICLIKVLSSNHLFNR